MLIQWEVHQQPWLHWPGNGPRFLALYTMTSDNRHDETFKLRLYCPLAEEKAPIALGSACKISLSIDRTRAGVTTTVVWINFDVMNQDRTVPHL